MAGVSKENIPFFGDHHVGGEGRFSVKRKRLNPRTIIKGKDIASGEMGVK